jgi:hypothetical protein
LCFLVSEGVSLPRIACIGHCAVSSIRLFLQGESIPDGTALRLIIASRAFRRLRADDAPLEMPASKAEADLAAFAHRWLNKYYGRRSAGPQ